MGKRRIMRKFKISEISPVDRPAQSPALALLMKRQDIDEIAKAAFFDALTAVNVERDIFEDLWKYNDALRASIKSIFEDPEKYPNPVEAVRESLAEFASAVTTMIEGSITIVGKAEKTEGGKEFPAKDYAYVPDPEKPSTWKLRLTSEPGGEPDPRIIGAAIAALGEGFRGQKVQIPEEDLSAVITRVRVAWKKAYPDKTKDDMPDVLKSEEAPTMKNENTPTVETLTEDLAKANARAEKAEKLAELTDVEKAHHSSLPESDREAFLKMDADARKAEINKAQEKDKVIYKADDGTEFRKSDDPRLVQMAKDRDEDRRIAKAEREKREVMELTKRAETELSNLPGDAPVKIAVLKAIDSITDEDTRKKATELLKAHNEAHGAAFVKRGTTQNNDTGNVTGRLDAMAKKYAEDHKVPFAKAYDEVLRTDEGKALYEQTL
jgi:hypothetical protein